MSSPIGGEQWRSGSYGNHRNTLISSEKRAPAGHQREHRDKEATQSEDSDLLGLTSCLTRRRGVGVVSPAQRPPADIRGDEQITC